MTLRSYIILMVLATMACYLGLGAVLAFFDPFSGGLGILTLFYASFFLSLLGTLALIGLILRLAFTSDKLVFKKVTTSFRQGIWLAFLICISLYLNRINLLNLKYLIPLILALAILEIFFVSYKPKHNQTI